MNIERFLRHGCFLILIGLALVARAGNDEAVVHIAGSAWIGDAPTKVADRLGFFNHDRAVNQPRVEVVDYDSGLEAIESLVNGHSQFALAATTPIATTLIEHADDRIDSPPDFVVLASVALSNRTHKLIARDGRDIHTPNRWVDKRIGVMVGSSSHFGWAHFARFHGLSEDNYTLVDIPVRDMAEALLADKVDAVVVWSPWERDLLDRVGEELIEFPLRMLYTVNWLLLADRQFAHEHSQVVDRVLRGYLKAVAFIDAEPERAHHLHADYRHLPLEQIIEYSRGMIWRVGLDWSVLVNMGAQVEWLTTQPEYRDRAALNPQQYLYGQPLRSLAPERVTLPSYLLLESLAPERQQ